jgi:aminoglycoside phosphotransferase family enzyme/predicted kinase
MVTEDQTEVIEFLSSPATHGGAAVERIDTHTAVVFLAGSCAWKLKRAVRFEYLDFSTVERRKDLCEEEVRLNQRTAPALYHGVVPVTRTQGGSLALRGSGTVVDWLVQMERFDQEALFDRLAESGRLDLDLMAPLVREIARFHNGAEARRDHGGKAGMQWIIDGNAAGFAEQGAGILLPAECRQVTDDSRAALERCGALLDARREAGSVRRCHGDLHLRNIVLLGGQPTLFDGVEFNDKISCIDVLYDLAFLLMDLWRRQLPRHANAIFNGYLTDTTHLAGIRLLPLFLSCRAAVRAKTSATAARAQSNATKVGELEQRAREYLAMAQQLLCLPPPCLIAIGGLSGSGKSTLALALAPSIGAVPGALVLRSDEIRKQLCGVSPLQPLGPEGYAPEITARVYDALVERAGLALRGGHSVIVDAVHARPADRAAIERIAASASVRFLGLWLDAAESTLVDRTRRRRHDPSDADEAVVRMQHAQETGRIDWHRIDASMPPERVQHDAERLYGSLSRSGTSASRQEAESCLSRRGKS